MTDRGSDLTGHKTYAVPVGQCSINNSQEKQKYLDMHSKTFTFLGKSNKKREQVPDVPTIKYSQGMQNSCIISSLASELYYMGDVHASDISSGASNCLLLSFMIKVECNSYVILLWE